MINIKKLDLDETRRMIITSDIHTNLKLFQELLEKVHFSKEDYLFINGDLCEKGPDSIKLIHYVRTLIQNNENIFLTKGNCDVVFRYVFREDEGILPYIKQRKHSILNEMMAIHGKSLDDFSGLKELGEFYHTYFQSEIEWLESLPVAYETRDLIIIHAGIDNHNDWYETDESQALYARAFYESGHQSEKTVVVGHWPVVNYRAAEASSHNPIIDLEKRIICIDGGNQIKQDGQLNALVIEGGEYTFTYVDELGQEEMIIRDYTEHADRVGTVTFPNYEMNLLKREDYFTLCENRKLGIQQWIKNEYLIEKDGQFFCKNDLSTTFVTVHSGEYVKVVDDACKGYSLIKKNNGQVGWIPRECIHK
ncbi:metallophosphoesterase [Ornithinibacillus xuwenensis]|uniref:Metallophosphoesterase n=1 Tax=Ornithinibacillus xuwenensis TaxID=3144668 RepID=A0ABU9XIU0_9BACI